TRGGQTARGLLRPREDVLAEPLSGDLGGLAGLLPGGGEVSLGVLLHTLGVLLGALDGLAGLLALLLRVLGGLLARVLGLLPQIVRAGGGLLADGAGLLGGGGLQRLSPVTADHRLLRQLVDHQMDLVRGGLSRLVGAHAPVLDLVVRLQHTPPALGELFPSCPQWALTPTAEEDAVARFTPALISIAPMKAILHTNHGDINVELFPNQAPTTVENFAGLATGEKE